MDINSAFNSASAALQRADQGLQRNAETVARTTAGVSEDEDLNTALVESTSNANLGRAAVNTVSSIDEAMETLGQLVDTRA
ncbi:hypothetical protein HC341_17170 [Aquisalimonas sp. 2447]|uniref:hypothetical protein n=1 Tax=Aquisalimonas sp. 2447 TaxID=2740807 RepID=UPI0014323C54|nr:hypothetical protein [Aquisalimonas sp. 2447]QIT56773.1 hypothetical protein HC341_17170 [Aquisalimonas sp. 2447]